MTSRIVFGQFLNSSTLWLKDHYHNIDNLAFSDNLWCCHIHSSHSRITLHLPPLTLISLTQSPLSYHCRGHPNSDAQLKYHGRLIIIIFEYSRAQINVFTYYNVACLLACHRPSFYEQFKNAPQIKNNYFYDTANLYCFFSYSNVKVEVDCLKGRKAEIQAGLEVGLVREAELALDEGEDVIVVTLAQRKLKRIGRILMTSSFKFKKWIVHTWYIMQIISF